MGHRFSDVIIRLANGISQRRMYFDAHPRVVATSREVAADIAALLRDTGSDAFSFGVYGGKFVRDGNYLVGPSIAGRSLIDFAERLGCGGFTFRLPLTPDHLITFFRLAAERSETSTDLAQAQALFAGQGIGHIMLAPPLHEGQEGGPDQPGDGATPGGGGGGASDYLAADFVPLVQIYQAMYDSVALNNLAVHSNGSIDIGAAFTAGAGLVDLAEHGCLDVMQFVRYPDYDSYTIGHSVRVAALSSLVARELGWPHDTLTELAAAGLLHDVGKGRIPDDILFKPGRLDADERRVIESHPALGAQILLDNNEHSPLILAATWGHHLRHEGGGYPHMPDWHRPGAVAELVHVCDVFEALTASRPYKKPMSPHRAYEIMLKDEGAYHPHLLALLIRTMGLYPPGSEVRLDDGRTAVVVAHGPTLDSPVVRVTRDSGGSLLARDEQPAIDLSLEPGPSIAGIVSVGMSSGVGAAEPVPS